MRFVLAQKADVAQWKPLLRWWGRWRHLQATVTANDLIAEGWKPGRALGEELHRLRCTVAEVAMTQPFYCFLKLRLLCVAVMVWWQVPLGPRGRFASNLSSGIWKTSGSFERW